MVLPSKKSKSVSADASAASALRPGRVVPRFFTLYDPPPQHSIDFTVLDVESGEYVPEKSLTQQSDAEACDLNKILARYERTGELPEMIRSDPGHYGDFSDQPTYLEGMNIVCKAQEQFAALDAPIRKRFDNDPAKFLAFASDPGNLKEMGKLGLLKPEAMEALQAAEKASREPSPPGGPGSPASKGKVEPGQAPAPAHPPQGG